MNELEKLSLIALANKIEMRQETEKAQERIDIINNVRKEIKYIIDVLESN